MAKILGDSYDFTRRQTKQMKYPWDEWLDGHVWEVTRGEDFSVKPDSFQNYLHTHAHGRAWVVDADGNTLATKCSTQYKKEKARGKTTEKVIFQFYYEIVDPKDVAKHDAELAAQANDDTMQVEQPPVDKPKTRKIPASKAKAPGRSNKASAASQKAEPPTGRTAKRSAASKPVADEPAAKKAGLKKPTIAAPKKPVQPHRKSAAKPVEEPPVEEEDFDVEELDLDVDPQDQNDSTDDDNVEQPEIVDDEFDDDVADDTDEEDDYEADDGDLEEDEDYEEEPLTEEELLEMSPKELRPIAEQMGVELKTRMTVKQLVAAIMEAAEAQADEENEYDDQDDGDEEDPEVLDYEDDADYAEVDADDPEN